MPFKMKTLDLTEDLNTTFPYSLPSSPESAACLPVGKSGVRSFAVQAAAGLSQIFTAPPLGAATQGKKEIKELHRVAALAGIDLEYPYQKQLRRFSYKELRKATDNFNEKNTLGEGTYGKVYKGYLSSCHQVAVKRFTKFTSQFRAAFKAEMQAGKMVMHRNVILLIGFCEMTKPKKLFLVYRFMGGDLYFRLFQLPGTQPPLDWDTRKKIALGVAKGLSYLHDNCFRRIVHRDIKSSNILLDENLEPCVTDFGLALIMDHKHRVGYGRSTQLPHHMAGTRSENQTEHRPGEHLEVDYKSITTRICGTHGYIAPEAVRQGKYSVKTDVFAYGVVLLELISSCHAHKLHMLAESEGFGLPADWIKRLLDTGNVERIVDSSLRANCSKTEVERLIKLSLICIQSHNPEKRPSMSEVVSILEGSCSSCLDIRWEEFQQNWIEYNGIVGAIDQDLLPCSTDTDFADAASHLDPEEACDFNGVSWNCSGY